MDLSTMDKAQAENQPQSEVSYASNLSSSKHSQSPTASRPIVPERVPMVQLERNLAWLQTASALPKGRNKGTALPEAGHSRQIPGVMRCGSSTSRAWSYSTVNSGFSTSRNSSTGLKALPIKAPAPTRKPSSSSPTDSSQHKRRLLQPAGPPSSPSAALNPQAKPYIPPGSSVTAHDASAHADAALQQLRHMVHEEASSSSANKQLISTALNKKEQEVQGLQQELKLLTDAKQAGLAKLKECSLQQQTLHASLEEQHKACAANDRQLERLSKQNEALQGDITAAQQYFADGQVAMQQALADAQQFGQQTRDLRGQQSQLQSSIAAATAVAQTAQQDLVLLEATLSALKATLAAASGQQALLAGDQHKQAGLQLLQQAVSVMGLQPESLFPGLMTRLETTLEEQYSARIKAAEIKAIVAQADSAVASNQNTSRSFGLAAPAVHSLNLKDLTLKECFNNLMDSSRTASARSNMASACQLLPLLSDRPAGSLTHRLAQPAGAPPDAPHTSVLANDQPTPEVPQASDFHAALGCDRRCSLSNAFPVTDADMASRSNADNADVSNKHQAQDRAARKAASRSSTDSGNAGNKHQDPDRAETTVPLLKEEGYSRSSSAATSNNASLGDSTTSSSPSCSSEMSSGGSRYESSRSCSPDSLVRPLATAGKIMMARLQLPSKLPGQETQAAEEDSTNVQSPVQPSLQLPSTASTSQPTVSIKETLIPKLVLPLSQPMAEPNPRSVRFQDEDVTGEQSSQQQQNAPDGLFVADVQGRSVRHEGMQPNSGLSSISVIAADSKADQHADADPCDMDSSAATQGNVSDIEFQAWQDRTAQMQAKFADVEASFNIAGYHTQIGLKACAVMECM